MVSQAKVLGGAFLVELVALQRRRDKAGFELSDLLDKIARRGLHGGFLLFGCVTPNSDRATGRQGDAKGSSTMVSTGRSGRSAR